MALKFKPEALFKGGAKAAPKKAAATKKVPLTACLACWLQLAVASGLASQLHAVLRPD